MQSYLHSPAWGARPNAAHLAVTGLQRAGRLRACVTSNIDGLHTDAGTTGVLEVHGSGRRWRCQDCPATGDMRELLDRVRAGDPDPRCPDCGGIARAATILFGELLDSRVIEAAADAAQDCDLFVAVGTSLTVHPAAGLLPLAFRSGAPAVIVNEQETAYDDLAAAVIREPVADVLATLLGTGVGAAGAAPGCDKPVYLTFDTGHMAVAPLIAEVLKRQGVKATFFLAKIVGASMRSCAAQAVESHRITRTPSA